MVEIVTTVASVITAAGVIIGVIIAAFKWFLRQEQQDGDGSDPFHHREGV